jgi:murein DD-endopeptidase MepM/ murein hydrolase activator NlpD
LTRRQTREIESAATAKSSTSKRPVGKRPALKRPAALTRPATKPKSGKPGRAARGARKFLSFGAALFALALVVGMSIPANLFLPVDTFSADAQTVASSGTSAKTPVQSIAVSEDAAPVAVARDEYGVTSYAELLRAQYGSQGGSFTATTGAIRWPFPYTVPITDGFGNRPSGTSGTSHHNGVDFTPGAGTPIYAVADGVVTTHSDDAYGYGNHVILSHNVGGESFDSVYAHMQTGTSPLNAGDVVKVGDFIGLVGDTGDSYGAHLHLEIRINSIPVDPFAWLQAHATN